MGELVNDKANKWNSRSTTLRANTVCGLKLDHFVGNPGVKYAVWVVK
jgi:hypothetical protein